MIKMIDDETAMAIYRGESPAGAGNLVIKRAAAPLTREAYQVGITSVTAGAVATFREPPRQVPMDEFGVTGLNRFEHHIYEEWHRELQGRRGMTMYREMWDNNAVIDTLVGKMMLLIAGAPWETKPADEGNAKAIELAEWHKRMMGKMEQDWSTFIKEALTAIVFGFFYGEEVYQVLDDGTYGLKKISSRSQESVDGWLYDEDSKEMIGMFQRPVYGPVSFVPLWKAFHFTPFQFRENPEGRSMLRAAYVPYKEIKNLSRFEGIGFERNVAGMPIAYAPPSYFDESATTDQKKLLETLAKMMYNLRLDERMGVVFPSEFNKDGSKSGFGFGFAQVQGSGVAPALGAAIVRRETRIAMTLHGEFVMLGQEGKTGSHAMHSDKTSSFGAGCYALLDMIADKYNKTTMRRLMRYNGNLDETLYPKLSHGDIDELALAEITTALTAMFNMGMDVSDPEIVSRLLKRMGLPTTADEEV